MAQVSFLKYQSAFLAACQREQIVVWEKSRRIGASWAVAHFAVSHAATGLGNVYYMSYEKEMTRGFIEDCKAAAGLYKKFMEPTAMQDDERKDTLIFELRFATGKTIKSLTSEPRNIRSRGRPGDVVILDEAAFVDNLPEFLKATIAVTMWGGKVIILSTHNGESNAFNALVHDTRAGRNSYTLLRTTLDDALADGLHKKICEVAETKWSMAAQNSWRATLIKQYGAGAEEELFCVPRSGGGGWLSGALIESAQRERLPVFAWSAPADFVRQSAAAKKLEAERFFAPAAAWLKSCAPAPWTLGVDFARRGDLSVFCLMRRRADMTREAAFLELDNIPFAEQETLMRLCVSACNANGGMADAKLDAGGNGQQLAEAAKIYFNAQEVFLSEGWYRENMPPLKAAFEDGLLRLPRAAGVYEDLRCVELVRGVPRVPQTRIKVAGQQRHGDSAIALALAFAGSREARLYFAPRAGGGNRYAAARGAAGDATNETFRQWENA